MLTGTKTIAALFVEEGGAYFGIDEVIPWTEEIDARKYRGPFSVVAHPPCERWGRYWHGGPSAKVRKIKGDDGGCFAAAFGAVVTYGGVLEHPEASAAWSAFGIPRPVREGGWSAVGRFGERRGWTCCVEQGHYGHRARKATWLFLVSRTLPPAMIWGPSKGERLDEGFHSAEERRAARAKGVCPRKRLSRKENLATPIAFRDVLLSMARDA